MKADVVFEWTDECMGAFQELKDVLTSDVVMAYPKDSGVLVLDTDASGTGIGATLSQVQYCEKSGKEEERPIAHASKSLTKAQRQYCVTRKELLAVMYFVQYFRHYLLGREFVIRTDHSALRWVMSFKDPRDQMARWLEVLCQYKFKIIHRDGKKHSNADALSRVPCDPAECSCYDGQSVLSDLPCGGCDVCNKKHEQWSSFQEVDDVVPLMARRVECKDLSCPSLQSLRCRLTGSFFMFIVMWITTLWRWSKAVVGSPVVQVCWMGHKFGGESGHKAVRRVHSSHADVAENIGPPLGDHLSDVKEQVESSCKKDSADNELSVNVPWLKQYSSGDSQKSQAEDPDIAPLVSWLELKDGKPTRDQVASESPAVRNLWLQWDQMVLSKKGVLYRKWHSPKKKIPPRLQLVVPRSLQDTVLESLHCGLTAGHLGIKKTISKVKKSFYWYRMKESIRTWIKNCTVCGARKSPNKKLKSTPQNYSVGAPMDRVATDILGPFPQSSSGNRYILLVGDYFTRWIEAYAIPEFSAKTVAEKLVHEFFSRFGTPFDLHSDQGRNYEASLFKEVCRLLEINKTRSSPYHPQSNGMIERFNRTLLDMIAVYTDQNQTDWDKYLPMLTSAYRSCAHEKTGLYPKSTHAWERGQFAN